MIGAVLQQKLNQQIAEFASTWIDLKTSFDYLYEAAKDFAKETRACHENQVITTVATQPSYNLNPDFLEVMTKDDHDNYVVGYSDGTNTTWLSWESWSDYVQNLNSPGTPTRFCIVDAPIVDSFAGIATATGSVIGGEATLTDAAATQFLTLYPGDYVVNTSGVGLLAIYSGVVLGAIATNTVKTAMFDITVRGGAYASWAINNTYFIQPASRYQIYLDPPPLTTGSSVFVTYLSKPHPVYSDYGTYPFATGYEDALVKYAAWLYRYRDSKPQLADPLYAAYERAMRKGKSVHRKAVGVVGYRINFMK